MPSKQPQRAGSINRKDSSNTSSTNGTSYNLLRLLSAELGLGTPSKVSEDDRTESKLIPTEESFEQIMNMIRLPIALEKLMIYGLLACLNSFLKLLVLLPLKLAIDLISLFRTVREQFTNRRGGTPVRTRVGHSNIIIASLIIWAMWFASVDTSMIYHKIRNQSSIKLYVMFGVLEISDKLLATVGQDLLNVVFSTTITSIKKPKHFFKFVLFYGLAVGYLSLHTVVLIYQTIALTVAANSYSNSLVTLLLSNQFSEIKGAVFKKIDNEGLFQMSCSDIVERFQLLTMLGIIGLRNLVQINNNTENIGILPNCSFKSLNGIIGVVLGPTMIVIGSELLVDWVKHSYITKMNKMKPQIYGKYIFLLSSDVMSSFKNLATTNASNTAYNDRLQQRLGLPLPALFVLLVVMSKDCLNWLLLDSEEQLIPLNLVIVVILYLILLMFKLLLELGLLKWSTRIIKHQKESAIQAQPNDYVQGLVTGGVGAMDKESRRKLYKDIVPPDFTEERRKKDSKSDLGRVVRYRMASKRIW